MSKFFSNILKKRHKSQKDDEFDSPPPSPVISKSKRRNKRKHKAKRTDKDVHTNATSENSDGKSLKSIDSDGGSLHSNLEFSDPPELDVMFHFEDFPHLLRDSNSETTLKATELDFAENEKAMFDKSKYRIRKSITSVIEDDFETVEPLHAPEENDLIDDFMDEAFDDLEKTNTNSSPKKDLDLNLSDSFNNASFSEGCSEQSEDINSSNLEFSDSFCQMDREEILEKAKLIEESGSDHEFPGIIEEAEEVDEDFDINKFSKKGFSTICSEVTSTAENNEDVSLLLHPDEFIHKIGVKTDEDEDKTENSSHINISAKSNTTSETNATDSNKNNVDCDTENTESAVGLESSHDENNHSLVPCDITTSSSNKNLESESMVDNNETNEVISCEICSENCTCDTSEKEEVTVKSNHSSSTENSLIDDFPTDNPINLGNEIILEDNSGKIITSCYDEKASSSHDDDDKKSSRPYSSDYDDCFSDYDLSKNNNENDLCNSNKTNCENTRNRKLSKKMSTCSSDDENFDSASEGTPEVNDIEPFSDKINKSEDLDLTEVVQKIESSDESSSNGDDKIIDHTHAHTHMIPQVDHENTDQNINNVNNKTTDSVDCCISDSTQIINKENNNNLSYENEKVCAPSNESLNSSASDIELDSDSDKIWADQYSELKSTMEIMTSVSEDILKSDNPQTNSFDSGIASNELHEAHNHSVIENITTNGIDDLKSNVKKSNMNGDTISYEKQDLQKHLHLPIENKTNPVENGNLSELSSPGSLTPPIGTSSPIITNSFITDSEDNFVTASLGLECYTSCEDSMISIPESLEVDLNCDVEELTNNGMSDSLLDSGDTTIQVKEINSFCSDKHLLDQKNNSENKDITVNESSKSDLGHQKQSPNDISSNSSLSPESRDSPNTTVTSTPVNTPDGYKEVNGSDESLKSKSNGYPRASRGSSVPIEDRLDASLESLERQLGTPSRRSSIRRTSLSRKYSLPDLPNKRAVDGSVPSEEKSIVSAVYKEYDSVSILVNFF